MSDVNEIMPIREEVLRLHILYLEKVDLLSKGERDAFEKYFTHLANPIYLTNRSGIDD